jgi:gamma-glutamyltranspeptidase / glutathione hydrolase
MLVRAPNGTYETIDFREKAPLLANQTMYVQNINLSLYGGLAVGVPGELAGKYQMDSGNSRFLGTAQ